MTEASTRTAPAGFIGCHQPNGYDVFLRISAITGMWTNAEQHAAIQTGNFEWIVRESIDEVIEMINTASPAQLRKSGKGNHKQHQNPEKKQYPKEDHAWPPPPDDMREGDLPKDPKHDPKNDTWERDRSDADAAKLEN